MVTSVKTSISSNRARRTASQVNAEQQTGKKQIAKANNALSERIEATVDRKSSRIASKRQPSTNNTAKTINAPRSSPEQQPEVALRRGSNRAKASTVKRKLPEAKQELSMQANDDEVKRAIDLSCITEDGLTKPPEAFDVPMASSPIVPTAKLNGQADVKSEPRPAGQQESGDTSKGHRGIVAEMYAHERRQARLSTATTNKTINGVSAGLINPLHAAVPVAGISPVSSAGYYPYGLPTMPTVEPILSPYGISPYAEPGSSWTTNVYVNNLPPHTTDDDLLRLGSCFGRIKSHKAIINQETGLCKGYGFLMYEFLHDAELALQQLPLHGLSTSWAKESFSSKLRRMADSTTSNIYLSNLPNDITATQLEQLFAPHQVISLRILTDPTTGTPRGVGFVRLHDREAAQDCIERLNGLTMPGQESSLQVRFADSEAQKSFKMCARVQLSKADDSRKTSDTSQTSEANVTNVQSFVSNSTAANVINGTPDQIFLAALQGQHTWTGFPTPVPANGDFSPLLSGAGNNTLANQLAEHDAFMQQMGLPQPWDHPQDLPLAAFPMMFDALQFHRKAFEAVETSPLHRLQWLANSQVNRTQPTPILSNRVVPAVLPAALAQQQLGNGLPTKTNKIRPTYLPPELAIQHARALMEKKGKHHGGVKPSEAVKTSTTRADIVALTEQHIENERAKLLQDAGQADEAKTSDEKVIATTGTAKNRASRSYSISAAKSVVQDRGTSTALAGMRQSVSSNSLLPLRFVSSKSSAVPIAVETALDACSHASVDEPVEQVIDTIHQHHLGGENGGERDSQVDESSYTSSPNSSAALDDSQRSSNVSAASMHKSDSGKNFDCGGMDVVYGDRHVVDVPVDAKHNANAILVNINGLAAAAAAAAAHPTPAEPRRSRSKSVLLQLPNVDAANETVKH